jgi:hypothetical protein
MLLGFVYSVCHAIDAAGELRWRISWDRRLAAVRRGPAVAEAADEVPAADSRVDLPIRPHPLDPRADDACPICRDRLRGGVELLLAVDPEGKVLAQIAQRALSKCGRCGSVAHADCVTNMLLLAARTNACAVCTPSF